jgi:renalase
MTDAGDQHEADALLLTLPVPQALTLLADSDFALDPTDRTALESVTYRACLAVLAVLNRPALLPAAGLTRFDDSAGPVALVVDNQQKGTSPDQPALTVYARPDYSLTRFDDDLTTVGHDLLRSLSDRIPPGSIETVQVHRWRYSTAGHRLSDPYRLLSAPFPLLIGGDGFGPGNVEGAFLSGMAMGEGFTVITR